MATHDRTYAIATAQRNTGKGAGKYHLIRPDRKRMVLCRAERNPYVDIHPMMWGKWTPAEWEKYGPVCANCLQRVGGAA